MSTGSVDFYQQQLNGDSQHRETIFSKVKVHGDNFSLSNVSEGSRAQRTRLSKVLVEQLQQQHPLLVTLLLPKRKIRKKNHTESKKNYCLISLRTARSKRVWLLCRRVGIFKGPTSCKIYFSSAKSCVSKWTPLEMKKCIYFGCLLQTQIRKYALCDATKGTDTSLTPLPG